MNPIQTYLKTHVRIVGALLIILGAGMTWFIVQTIMTKIAERAPTIWVSSKYVIFSVTFIMIGLSILIAPKKVEAITEEFKETRRINGKFIFYYAIILPPGIATWIWLKSFIEDSGYQF